MNLAPSVFFQQGILFVSVKSMRSLKKECQPCTDYHADQNNYNDAHSRNSSPAQNPVNKTTGSKANNNSYNNIHFRF